MVVPKARLVSAWGVFQEVFFGALRKKSREEYAVCMRRALRELPDELTTGALTRWHRVTLLTDHKLSETYANACLQAVRTVARRAATISGDHELAELCWRVLPVRTPIRAPRTPPRDLLQRSLACCDGLAERCFVLLAGLCGLRRGEILGLKPEDWDPALATLRIVRQRRSGERKNRTPHVCVIDSPDLRAALEWTLAHRDEIRPLHGYWRPTAGSSEGYVFPWSLRRVEDFMVRLRAKLGPAYFPRRAAFHLFRHWGATELARAGASLWEIQAWLGDASPRAATGYIAMVRGETVSGTRGLALLAGLGD